MASGSSLTRKLERGNQDYIVIMVLSYRLNAVVSNLSLVVATLGLINDSTAGHHTGGQHVAIKLLLRERNISACGFVFVCCQPLGQSQGR